MHNDNRGHRGKENGARRVQNKELMWPGGLGKADLWTGCLSGDLKTDMSELEEGGQVQWQVRSPGERGNKGRVAHGNTGLSQTK